ncbi:MAG TPA: hypothetical protein PLJ12_14415, partial [Planctomycetota bacterium]|nr:hypothetical protein [Planctomycetota bacterium]
MAQPTQLQPQSPLTALPGIGKAKAEGLAKAGLRTLSDLMLVRPLGVLQWPGVVPVAEALTREGSNVRIRGTVRSMRLTRFGGRRNVVRWQVEDEHGTTIAALWFNQPWMTEVVPQGAEVELFGTVVDAKGPALATPQVGHAGKPLPAPGSLFAQYAPPAGFSSEFLAQRIAAAIEACADRLRDPLPPDALALHDLPELGRAVRGVHQPQSLADFEAGRRRLALEPLLHIQANLQTRRAGRGGGARAARLPKPTLVEIAGRFPYTFTLGQKQVITDILRDLARRVPMRRLVQGDVGSGKTALALFAAMAVVEAGKGKDARTHYKV